MSWDFCQVRRDGREKNSRCESCTNLENPKSHLMFCYQCWPSDISRGRTDRIGGLQMTGVYEVLFYEFVGVNSSSVTARLPVSFKSSKFLHRAGMCKPPQLEEGTFLSPRRRW